MTTELTDIRALCGGAVALPGDEAYEAGRSPWNSYVDQRPAMIAYPATPQEVAEVMHYARDAGLRVAPQSTGHNAAPLGDLSDSVLLRTSAFTEISIDADQRIARVGGGVLWQDVVEAAAAHGLYPLHGSSPDVAVAGYSLGGGIGWLARLHGLQANSLTAIEIVTAGGEIVRADAEHHADLFWALRGGGGNFGVVTALEFRLYEYTEAYGGMLVWDWQHAERVLRAWVEWSRSAPANVTTSWRILQIPDIEDAPPPLRGRQVVVIDGAVIADEERAAEIIAPLRDLEPEMDLWATMPAAGLTHIHGDPEAPTPTVSDTAILDGIDEEAIRALIGVAGPDSNSPLFMVELRQLGGALAHPAEGGGALSHFDGEFILFAGHLAATPEMAAVGDAASRNVVGTMWPWNNGRHYLNFAESKVEARAGFRADAYERLRAVRDAYDPQRRMRANHEIS